MAVWPLLIIQIIAVTLTLHGAPSRSALLAMGRQHQVLRIVFFGTLVFHSSALLLIPSIGAMGANIAQVLLGSEEHTSELQSIMRISYAVFCLKKIQLTKK